MTVRHIVLFSFKPEAAPTDIVETGRRFAQLAVDIPGIEHFEAGVNNSPEGHAKGFTHAFVMHFIDLAARDAYLPHPLHQAFVQTVGPLLADVLVVDYLPTAC